MPQTPYKMEGIFNIVRCRWHEADLENIKKKLDQHDKEFDTMQKELGEKLDALKTTKTWVVGVIAGVSGAVGAAIAVATLLRALGGSG